MLLVEVKFSSVQFSAAKYMISYIALDHQQHPDGPAGKLGRGGQVTSNMGDA